MQRIRLALLSTLLLGLALASVPGSAGASRSQHDTVSFDAQQVLVKTAVLPAGAGIGGGDKAEVEPNDTLPTANVANDLPFNCTGTIGTNGDEDVLAVPMVAGMPIEVNVISHLDGGIQSPLDPEVVVRTAEAIIEENDDAAPSDRNAQVNFIAPSTETLYIVVKSHGGLGGPSFTYVVMALPVTGSTFDQGNREREPNDAFTQANEIVPPGVRVGLITRSNTPFGDAPNPDLYYFDAPAGATAVIDVSARVLGYPTDPAVMLQTWPRTRWTFSVDDVDGVDPRFNIKLETAGRYYVWVSSALTESESRYYIVSVTLQDGTDSPTITKLKRTQERPRKLKKVIGSGFDAAGMVVELNDGVVIPSVPSTVSPTTRILVEPHVDLVRGDPITVVRPNGRRSNILPF
jgi:hypothetical protein